MITAGQDAKLVKRQHKEPCHDCPWRRVSTPGWLGNRSADEWVQLAHSEGTADCHTRRFANGQEGPYCAGLAIYRANVCKSLRDPNAFRLNANRDSVFASPIEFIKHHKRES